MILEPVALGASEPDADERYARLKAAWQQIGVSGLLMHPKYRYLHTSVAHWQAFEKKWESGDRDVGELTGAEASARIVLQTFRDDGHPEFDPRSVPGGDLEQATAPLRAAAATNDAVTSAEKGLLEAVQAIPTEYKVGAAVGITVLLFLAVRAR